MNSTTIAAQKITSLALAEFIQTGGEVTRLETINHGEGDREIHVLEVEGREGTYTSDNAGISWFDAAFDRVFSALAAGDVSDLPEARGMAAI